MRELVHRRAQETDPRRQQRLEEQSRRNARRQRALQTRVPRYCHLSYLVTFT